MVKKNISIEIVYAEPEKQILIKLEVEIGTNIKKAILKSNILSQINNLSIDKLNVGIFGKQKSLEDIPVENDRIEIYRSLKIDPKEARRIRAKEQKKQKDKN